MDRLLFIRKFLFSSGLLYCVIALAVCIDTVLWPSRSASARQILNGKWQTVISSSATTGYITPKARKRLLRHIAEGVPYQRSIPPPSFWSESPEGESPLLQLDSKTSRWTPRPFRLGAKCAKGERPSPFGLVHKVSKVTLSACFRKANESAKLRRIIQMYVAVMEKRNNHWNRVGIIWEHFLKCVPVHNDFFCTMFNWHFKL